jgi:hypothetical protein
MNDQDILKHAKEWYGYYFKDGEGEECYQFNDADLLSFAHALTADFKEDAYNALIDSKMKLEAENARLLDILRECSKAFDSNRV